MLASSRGRTGRRKRPRADASIGPYSVNFTFVKNIGLCGGLGL